MKIKDIFLENEQLKERVIELESQLERKEKMLNGIKLNNSKLTLERNDLIKENMKRIEESNKLFGELQDIKHLSMWEFAAKYCTNDDLEEAGHQLAKDLLGR